MNETTAIPPLSPALASSSQRATLEKLQKESEAAAQKAGSLQADLKRSEAAITESEREYAEAIAGGDQKAAKGALSRKADAEVARDIAKSQLLRAEEAAYQARRAHGAERMKLAMAESTWTKLRSRLDPLSKRFIAARAELSQVILEIRAVTDEIMGEQETARVLRAALGAPALASPKVTLDRARAVVMAACSHAKDAGPLSGPTMASWLNVMARPYELATFVLNCFELPFGTVSGQSPEGVRLAEELLEYGHANRPGGRDTHTAAE